MTAAAEPVWEYDVGLTTHALLQEGVCVAWWTLVRVAAGSEVEASRTAIQLAWCGPEQADHYVTVCLLREWPEGGVDMPPVGG